MIVIVCLVKKARANAAMQNNMSNQMSNQKPSNQIVIEQNYGQVPPPNYQGGMPPQYMGQGGMGGPNYGGQPNYGAPMY